MFSFGADPPAVRDFRSLWLTNRNSIWSADLANRKGYVVTKAIIRDHVRLRDPEGPRVVKDGGSSAFSHAEARRFLEALSDRKREK